MKKYVYLLLFAATVTASSCVKDRVFPTVATGPAAIIHYWNFNNTTTFNHLIAPTTTTGGASLAYTAPWDDVSPGSDINARNSDSAGSALRLRNPAGVFTIAVPTTGYRAIVVQFAAARTSAGAQVNNISYTTDGTNYITTGIAAPSYTLDEDTYKLLSFNLSAIDAVNANPNFKIKIEFANGNTNSSGNDRFDNLTVEGIKL